MCQYLDMSGQLTHKLGSFCGGQGEKLHKMLTLVQVAKTVAGQKATSNC